MFSRKEKILKKTGPNGIGRYQYLSLLVKEFYTTDSLESRQQILANLANFSYDPINYKFIQTLSIIDLFLNQLSVPEDESLINYSLGGLCNLSADTDNQTIIIQQNGISIISKYLNHKNKEISLNALTTLLFLINSENKHYLTLDIIREVILLSDSDDKRLVNMGSIFLQDLCSEEEIISAKKSIPSCNLLKNIPLPSK